jgi:aconitate hydratase
MVFDLDLIKNLYAALPAKVKAARSLVGHPLTLAEKILYAHLYNPLTAAYKEKIMLNLHQIV